MSTAYKGIVPHVHTWILHAKTQWGFCFSLREGIVQALCSSHSVRNNRAEPGDRSWDLRHHITSWDSCLETAPILKSQNRVHLHHLAKDTHWANKKLNLKDPEGLAITPTSDIIDASKEHYLCASTNENNHISFSLRTLLWPELRRSVIISTHL